MTPIHDLFNVPFCSYYSQDADTSSLAHEASVSDIGYATATCTCTGPSYKDATQGQTLWGRNHLPPTQAGITLPLQMVKKHKPHFTTKSHLYTCADECLSQPTVEEHQTNAWPPMQDHSYAYYSDCLAQDIFQEQTSRESRYSQPQLGNIVYIRCNTKYNNIIILV